MSSKKQAAGYAKTKAKGKSSKSVTKKGQGKIQQRTNPGVLIQRALLNPQSLTSDDVFQLQHTLGNKTVNRLLNQNGHAQAATFHHIQTKLNLDIPQPLPGYNVGHAVDRVLNIPANNATKPLNGAVQRHGAQEEPDTINRAIQRHPEGTELEEKDDQVTEIEEKEQATSAPMATRTKEEAKSEKKEAKKAGKAFKKSQKLTPGAMSLAAAEKILQGSYGGFKKIVPGTIVILADQPACSAKYDEICINEGILRPDGSAWQPGDNAKDDAAAGVRTEGFAWKGVVYVNGKTTLVTATAHEILHNNTEPNFRGKVGETFNEGVTETLARQALKDAGIKVPKETAYPAQVKLTKLLIKRVGLDVVKKGYFEDVQKLVNEFLSKASGTWAQLVTAAEALDTDKVKEALKKKKSK